MCVNLTWKERKGNEVCFLVEGAYGPSLLPGMWGRKCRGVTEQVAEFERGNDGCG